MVSKLEVMYGSLLHDIGKIIYRSNSREFSKGTHSKLGWEYLQQFEEFKKSGIEESIRFHHYKELSKTKIQEDSGAYITYIADNIASGIDRRDSNEEGDENVTNLFAFNRKAPLSSIFNIVNLKEKGETKGRYVFGTNEFTKYPVTHEIQYTSGDYLGLKNKMDYDLRYTLKVSEDYFNSLVQWVESLWSFIPSSTNEMQLMDISLFDHSKITCAVASCIFDYLEEKEIKNYKETLFSPYQKTKDFYEEEAFLMFSMDMSGIQDFIYNISGTKALKSLRARSFYLELVLEHLVDALLKRVDMSRANLLYTGGGHAYLLLSNTEKVKKEIKNFEQEVHEWFLSEFTTDLAVSMAYEVCSGSDLMNSNGNYKKVWRQVSINLSEKKAQRYTAGEIIRLNQTHSYGERECRECLRSDLALSEDGLCPICEGLINISNDLRDKSFFLISDKGKVSLPFGKFLSVVDEKTAEREAHLHSNIHLYTKNNPFTGKGVSTNLWMCDYDLASKNFDTKELGIASYAKRQTGIQRLGVLRADVDNLGATFISGIPEEYNSLSRTATFSRNLSMFFKYELNNILSGSKITAIYSGGDDVFLIGAWDEITDKALEMRKKFAAFTMDKLSFSAGIGMFFEKYPISKMASSTGALEDWAKTGEKNQVVLWMKDKIYSWEDLDNGVLGEKLTVIKNAFAQSNEHGKAWIYKLLELLRDSEEINFARIAYLLARSEMSDEFSQKIFNWVQDDTQKGQLITAFEYYIYQIREG